MGTELVYTPNEHHHQSLKNVIERYLKPDGIVWFCQSDNRCDLANDLLAILRLGLATCLTDALVFPRENGDCADVSECEWHELLMRVSVRVVAAAGWTCPSFSN